MVQRQPGQIVHKTLSRKNPSQKKKWARRVPQGVGPKFILQYHKNKISYVRSVPSSLFPKHTGIPVESAHLMGALFACMDKRDFC
jgi:hypothetical protein